jgi:tRNA-splicing ligase RtcB
MGFHKRARDYGIQLPDRQLACAPIDSPLGQKYLGAMRAAINCALADREIITHLARQAFGEVLPQAQLSLPYDVSHNTCKAEEHAIDGKTMDLYVHRGGATRAFGSGDPAIPAVFQGTGQPVLIGGSMGTASYILVGMPRGESLSFGSSCHGAGRSMSRHQALRQWRGRELVDQLASQGVLIRSPSLRGVAENPSSVQGCDRRRKRGRCGGALSKGRSVEAPCVHQGLKVESSSTP